MNEATFRALRDQVCAEWQRLEKYGLAYGAGYEISRRRASLINLLIIIFGAFAGASGLIALAGETIASVVTGIVGIVTAILAGIRQHYKWDERTTEYWQALSTIERLKADLQNYVWSVATTGGQRFEPLFFQQNAERFAQATGLPVDNVPRFEGQAKANLQEQRIRTLTLEVVAIVAVAPEPVAGEGAAAGMQLVQKPDFVQEPDPDP